MPPLPLHAEQSLATALLCCASVSMKEAVMSRCGFAVVCLDRGREPAVSAWVISGRRRGHPWGGLRGERREALDGGGGR